MHVGPPVNKTKKPAELLFFFWKYGGSRSGQTLYLKTQSLDLTLTDFGKSEPTVSPDKH